MGMDNLSVEELINKVVDKVRALYRGISAYSHVLNASINVKVDYNKDARKLILKSISFNNWDELYITSKEIRYIPYNDGVKSTTLITYESFEELLNL